MLRNFQLTVYLVDGNNSFKEPVKRVYYSLQINEVKVNLSLCLIKQLHEEKWDV
jgi:hypothetical protein